MLDPQGRILSVNEPLAEWLEETSEGLIGCDWSQVLSQRRPEWEPGIRAWTESTAEFRTEELPGPSDQPDGWIRLTGAAAPADFCSHRILGPPSTSSGGGVLAHSGSRRRGKPASASPVAAGRGASR